MAKKMADVNAVVTANGGEMVQQAPKPVSFSTYMTSEAVMRSIASTIQDERKRQRFITTLVSTVTTNPLLASCDRKSIVSSALVAESLNLPTTPQLGLFYLVPFKNKAKYDKNGIMIAPECYTATPVIGWKGYYQLAIRTGQYRSIEVVELREGEVKSIDRLTNKLQIEFIEDDDIREKTPVIGYYAEFELLNGFHKSLYWSKKKMVNHADTYSPAFSKEAVTGEKMSKVSFADYEAGKYDKKDEWKYSSFWYKDFNAQAKKTMLRQLISKYGIMSTELEKAFIEDEQTQYVDQETGEIVGGMLDADEPTAQEIQEAIENE